MKDTGRDKRVSQGLATTTQATEQLPIDVAGIIGGRARRVPDDTGRPADSMLAVYKQRLTYTFICDNDVASIHFDAYRHEIFFRGHTIKFMALSPSQITALRALATVLAADREGNRLAAAYTETLAHVLAETTA